LWITEWQNRIGVAAATDPNFVAVFIGHGSDAFIQKPR
jgi:hypothetical protein